MDQRGLASILQLFKPYAKNAVRCSNSSGVGCGFGLGIGRITLEVATGFGIVLALFRMILFPSKV